MTLNRVKPGHSVTFMKYLGSIVSLIWNKITFLASNLQNFAELVENELMESIRFIAAYCRDFKSTFRVF